MATQRIPLWDKENLLFSVKYNITSFPISPDRLMPAQSCSHFPYDEWVTGLCVTHIDGNQHTETITTAALN